MTAAFAPAFLPILDLEDVPSVESSGAQSLLAPQGGKASYLTQAAGLALYALILVAVVTYTARPRDQAEEEPIPLVMLPAPEAQAEVPPKIEEPPPPPPAAAQVQPDSMPPVVEPVPEPPPPVAAEPLAPVKPEPVPVPEEKKPVEHKPISPQRRVETPPRAVAPAPPAPPPSNAIPSGYANQVHARVARVAINSYPRAAQLRNETGRVSYHIVIGPSGELISKNIVPSGNATFDAAATEALSRSAPFPAPGTTRPVSLSGAITYRMN